MSDSPEQSSRDPRPLVAHVIHRLSVGGLENGLVNLINRLPESGWRHAIVCIEDYTDFSARIRRSDVRLFAMNRSSQGVRRMRWSLFRLFRSLRPDIVHTRNMSALDALLPAMLAGVRHRVHGEHGRDADDPNGENRKNILLRKLHRPLIGHYITVSRDLQRYLVDRIAVPPERITQIYNGVDTTRFSPAGPSLLPVAPEGFDVHGRMVIGTVGRMDPVKDQVSLLRAAARLLSAHPDWRSRLRVMIVGDGSLMNDLRVLAQSLGIGSLVWFPGATDRVADALRSLDVFVLPSLGEGISNTILESMATGLPIVATRVGGNPELVEEGRFGHLYPATDETRLAELLESYLADEQLRRTHGAAARDAALARFSLDAMMQGYSGVYRRCL
ncbi:MAG: TIGR03088 family PEP-CTERM/XrtA system glycosyltransferase [Betaproteobacteria bacterium]|nr:TIGR03088 family PEP-CTERM/XrtA system glycosyltransferase [Betaproteobacteria bacterium]